MQKITQYLLIGSAFFTQAIITIPVVTIRNDIKEITKGFGGRDMENRENRVTKISIDIATDKAWSFLTGGGDKDDKTVNTESTRSFDLKGAIPREVSITWNGKTIKWAQNALKATVAGWQEAVGQSEDYLFVVNRTGITMAKKLSIQGNSYLVIGTYKWATPTTFEKSSSKQKISA